MRLSPATTRKTRPRRSGPALRRAVSALPALLAAACVLAAAGCTTLAPHRPDPTARAWETARAAMRGGSFARAERGFAELAESRPERPEGRESLFLLGVLYLDPRNPAWDPERAESHLGRYLRLDGPQDHRPEALALFALTRRLVESPESDREGEDQRPPQQVPVEDVGADVGRSADAGPAADGAAEENGRLQRQLAEKDREIARLREELERIRRTLSPP